MSTKNAERKHYAYRQGSRDYPRGIAGPFGDGEIATSYARDDRERGIETGRVRKVTEAELVEAREKLKRGILPAGW